MIKARLKAVIEEAVSRVIANGSWGWLAPGQEAVVIEKPKLPGHGDFSCGLALKLARAAKMDPLKIAREIACEIKIDRSFVTHFEVARPGFINFDLGPAWLQEGISEILCQKVQYGKGNSGRGQKVLIDYVSANPTGDLPIGAGRGAVYGSCLANLMSFLSYEVEQEFYINDTAKHLAADAAYHLKKYERGYDRLITIWGFEHHGQVPGLKAAIKALGKDPELLEVILTQIVNLSRDGQMVAMSRRAARMVSLQSVIDEVGVDAVAYYLAESSPQNPINFDLALAGQISRENPAFYIQYAHARCCAILRKALEPSINTETGEQRPPLITSQQWMDFQDLYQSSPDVLAPIFDPDPQVFACQKTLITRLESFPEQVEQAAASLSPGRLARYAYELANDLQKFYEVCRVITGDLTVTRARLGLILATRQVLANVLGIIGISAPERM